MGKHTAYIHKIILIKKWWENTINQIEEIASIRPNINIMDTDINL